MNAPLLSAVLCQGHFFIIQIDLASPQLFLNGVRVRGSAINGWPKLSLDFKLTYVEQIIGRRFGSGRRRARILYMMRITMGRDM